MSAAKTKRTVCSACRTEACWQGLFMCDEARVAGVYDLDVEDEPVPPPAPGNVRLCSRLQWCSGMSLALRGVPENHEGKGLSVSRGWLGEEEHARVIGITYRAKAKDMGVILNFCPWCGMRIRFDESSVRVAGAT